MFGPEYVARVAVFDGKYEDWVCMDCILEGDYQEEFVEANGHEYQNLDEFYDWTVKGDNHTRFHWELAYCLEGYESYDEIPCCCICGDCIYKDVDPEDWQ